MEVTLRDVHKLLDELKSTESEENFASPKACGNTELEKASEDILDLLPDVPNDLDVEIEARLLKLKFFNRVWESRKHSTTMDQFSQKASDSLDFDSTESSMDNKAPHDISEVDDNFMYTFIFHVGVYYSVA